MRLKATVETLNRDVIMKTKPAYSLISLGKQPPAKDNPNEDPKVYSERYYYIHHFRQKLS